MGGTNDSKDVTAGWRFRLNNAIEVETRYNRDGKCIRRRWSIGGVVIWGIVMLVAILVGDAVIPHGVWKWLMP